MMKRSNRSVVALAGTVVVLAGAVLAGAALSACGGLPPADPADLILVD